MAFPIHPRRIDKLVGVHGERIKNVSKLNALSVHYCDTARKIHTTTYMNLHILEL